MRIAYVTETFPPEINGVSLTCERTVRHLRRSGHAVLLVRPRQRGEAARDDADEWRTSGAPLPMYPELRFGWAGGTALRAHWRRHAIDLVHVATPGPLAWGALESARVLGLATSADFRTNFHTYSRHYRLGWLEPLVLHALRAMHKLADVNFVPTPALAASLAAHGFVRLRVCGRGVDAVRFNPAQRDPALRRAWGADDTTPVLFYAGRIAAEKNVALALRVFETLRQVAPQWRFVLVGDGPARARLQARHPAATFAGVQRGEALARHYASADAFIFPSLTETFGNVTLEALASGLPVLAFDCAAASLHVQHRRSGWLAPPGDETAFGQLALDALSAGAPPPPMRAAARARALAAAWDDVLQGFEQQLLHAAVEHVDARLETAVIGPV